MMNNKKGFSAFEILVVIVLYATVFVVISLVALNSANKTKFKALIYDAIAFSYNAKTYAAYNKVDFNRKIYLDEIVKYDESYNITSPFNANNKCSLNESYVVMKNDKLLVTLKCDNYMVYEFDINNKESDIYYVSDCEDEEPSKNNKKLIDQIVLYNYKKGNNYVLKYFVPEEIFIYNYNEIENTDYDSINKIHFYEKKVCYRERKVVSEVNG